MFDSQKLNFESWLKGYKHGVYVFTNDTCSYCQKLKQEISYINNHYLYFVEVNLQPQKDLLFKMTNRVSLPMTVFYKDGDLKEVILGKLQEHQVAKVLEFLKPFGDAPLSKEEVDKRMHELETKCQLTYYIFSSTTTNEQRTTILEQSIKHNEFAIDVDTVVPTLSIAEREHLLAGSYKIAKLVIYQDGKSKMFSPLGQKVLLSYTSRDSGVEFDVRNIEEELK